MMRAWGCVLLAGCGFSAPSAGGDGGLDPSDDAAVEAGVDAAGDAPPSSCSGVSYGAAPYTICLPAQPTLPFLLTALGTATVNTDTCAFTSGIIFTGQKVAQAQAGAPMICVIAASAISITGQVTVQAQGSLPLALLSHGDLTLGGAALVDVSGDSTGAAGNAVGCTVVGGGSNDGGGGGGAGGSFQTRGGDGTAVEDAGAGSTAAQAATPTFLRGGCPGGAGGNHTGAAAGGLGGRGGGAVYLLARMQLRIDGSINASGSGGLPTMENGRGGGGGGGSGGMIALWGGSSIAMGNGAQVWANGGGAAGGSDGDSNRGGPGGQSAAPGTPGRGGAQGASGATAGGNGAIGTETGAAGAENADKSGGGGGGGVGWIENVGPGAALSPGMFSPPAR